MTTITSHRRGHAAALWALAYGILGAAWALGFPGYPWGASDPDPDRALSILAGTTPNFGWWIAAFALLTAVTALALTHRRDSRVPLLLAWPIAAVLILVIPDSRLMMGVAYTPLLLIAPAFGWSLGGATFADAWPWPVLNQLVCVLGGLLLAAAALAHDRSPRGWFSPERGRRAVYVAVAVPLLYCATRWAWALGIPLGVSDKFLAEGEDGLWLAGAYLATFGALGGVLTLGLTQRWGEVFPRWLPVLRGRRVPPLLAVIPAGFVSIIITVAGLTYIRWTIAGRFALAEWGAWLPECFWPLWGAALAAATVSYHQRRKHDAHRTLATLSLIHI
ncbi:hypothetical protein ETD86_46535 [Nonomuraea turkmeniaca]|uniref:Uncharacterized protein n=1 Tax=Nonomuraea turkmeniaca TaxID=103838 RepID=A0A5S4FI82_9ACTN|nr:hypothetical protein [Nonomuraea turkmeniaca]TMR08745.1 hypothetical protein ETD86_46535 [Nonomuraea turkmeniaca]